MVYVVGRPTMGVTVTGVYVVVGSPIAPQRYLMTCVPDLWHNPAGDYLQQLFLSHCQCIHEQLKFSYIICVDYLRNTPPVYFPGMTLFEGLDNETNSISVPLNYVCCNCCSVSYYKPTIWACRCLEH